MRGHGQAGGARGTDYQFSGFFANVSNLSPNNQACRIKDGGCPLVDDNAALCLIMYSIC